MPAIPAADDAQRITTVVAADVLRVRPRCLGPLATATEEAELWPVFVVVLGEPSMQAPGTAAALFELLGRDSHPLGAEIVGGRCDWTVVDPGLALVRCAVHAEVPVRFAIEILIPVGRVLNGLTAVAHGGMVALTTRLRAARLTSVTGLHQVLREVVLLGCAQPPHLASLADSLHVIANTRRTGLA